MYFHALEYWVCYTTMMLNFWPTQSSGGTTLQPLFRASRLPRNDDNKKDLASEDQRGVSVWSVLKPTVSIHIKEAAATTTTTRSENSILNQTHDWIMSKTAQRKAWNEAMRSAAGTAALPPALQPRTQKRRSDRRKKQDRRDKARKTTAIQGPESKQLASASWMDALEGVLATNNDGDGDGDDSYDELDELESKKGSKKRRKPTKKQQELAGSLPKRFKSRTVANILLEEVNREDGVAYAWLEDEARIARRKGNNKNNKTTSRQGPIDNTAKFLQLPARKFCPVTGMGGIYTEPKSGLPYANLKALEQVRERPPPWMNLSGSLAYHEAVKSIRDEEDEAWRNLFQKPDSVSAHCRGEKYLTPARHPIPTVHVARCIVKSWLVHFCKNMLWNSGWKTFSTCCRHGILFNRFCIPSSH